MAAKVQDQLRIDVENFEAYCVASQEWLRIGYETLRSTAKTKQDEEVLTCISKAYQEIQALKLQFNQYHRVRRTLCRVSPTAKARTTRGRKAKNESTVMS